jgi:hypothetical protein
LALGHAPMRRRDFVTLLGVTFPLSLLGRADEAIE